MLQPRRLLTIAHHSRELSFLKRWGLNREVSKSVTFQLLESRIEELSYELPSYTQNLDLSLQTTFVHNLGPGSQRLVIENLDFQNVEVFPI